MILWGGLLCNGSPPFIKSSEKYKWNVRTVRGTMGSGKFEFCGGLRWLNKIYTIMKYFFLDIRK